MLKTVFFLLICHSFSANGQGLTTIEKLDSISINFSFDGSTLTAENKKLIKDHLVVLATEERLDFIVMGYTDTVGNFDYNKKLCSKRLTSVMKAISSVKLEHIQIDTFNLNESQFTRRKLRNTTLPEDEKLRRVDILIYRKTYNYKLNEPLSLAINFYSGLDRIVPDSYPEMKTLVEILKENMNYNIKLNGHVCCGSNLELSQDRSKKVRDYLMKNGIDPRRIACKGFSNTVPLVEEKTEADMAMNRRVEVIFWVKEE